MLTKQQALKIIHGISEKTAQLVVESHTNRKTWDKTTGQVIVYGLESIIGFNKAADVCAVAERYHKESFESLRTLICEELCQGLDFTRLPDEQ